MTIRKELVFEKVFFQDEGVQVYVGQLERSDASVITSIDRRGVKIWNKNPRCCKFYLEGEKDKLKPLATTRGEMQRLFKFFQGHFNFLNVSFVGFLCPSKHIHQNYYIVLGMDFQKQ